MINLITNKDFIGNLEKIFSGGADATEYLNDIIKKYQKEILIDILGEIEYYNFENDFAEVSGVIAPQTTKWINFLDGTDYIDNDIHYDYKGIKPVLIKMIYYYWQVETASILAESGELTNNQINSKKVIPKSKMVRSYNDGLDLIYNSRPYSPTVYNYLVNDGTFTNWIFTKRDKLNILGI